MLYNDDLLFIHIPKTAGTSVRAYLSEALPGVENVDGPPEIPAIHHGTKHINLAGACIRLGRDPSDFKTILAVIRDPYDMEWAWYNYMRSTERVQHVFRSIVAHDFEFEEYLHHMDGIHPGYFWYLNWARKIPENLTLINMDGSIPIEKLMKGIVGDLGGDALIEFPHLKKNGGYPSLHKVMTPEIDHIIRERYAWTFEQGYYLPWYDDDRN